LFVRFYDIVLLLAKIRRNSTQKFLRMCFPLQNMPKRCIAENICMVL